MSKSTKYFVMGVVVGMVVHYGYVNSSRTQPQQ